MLFAAVAFLGGAQPDYRTFRAFVLDHADPHGVWMARLAGEP